MDEYNDVDDFDGDGAVPLEECCICLADSVMLVSVQTEVYPFCEGCSHRSTFLLRGRALGWPALRIEGITGTYAIDHDVQAWVFNALQATDERIVELTDALDEHEQTQPRDAA